jgi:methylated-DNA-[protein]-cysteine S-methyltransferase
MKLDLSGRTLFERKVYQVLRRVPAGKVISYGELARRAGYSGAARAVGTAMKKNRLPIVIPCHRVIPASGGFGEYSAGKKWKCWLLKHEGHQVTKTPSHQGAKTKGR